MGWAHGPCGSRTARLLRSMDHGWMDDVFVGCEKSNPKNAVCPRLAAVFESDVQGVSRRNRPRPLQMLVLGRRRFLLRLTREHTLHNNHLIKWKEKRKRETRIPVRRFLICRCFNNVLPFCAYLYGCAEISTTNYTCTQLGGGFFFAIEKYS